MATRLHRMSFSPAGMCVSRVCYQVTGAERCAPHRCCCMGVSVPRCCCSWRFPTYSYFLFLAQLPPSTGFIFRLLPVFTLIRAGMHSLAPLRMSLYNLLAPPVPSRCPECLRRPNVCHFVVSSVVVSSPVCRFVVSSVVVTEARRPLMHEMYSVYAFPCHYFFQEYLHDNSRHRTSA